MAKAKVLGMMGDFAVAEAAKLCNPDVLNGAQELREAAAS